MGNGEKNVACSARQCQPRGERKAAPFPISIGNFQQKKIDAAVAAAAD